MSLPQPPLLMPHQMDAFNADFYIEQEFLELKKRFNLVNAIETGTCFGSTTLFLAKNFQKVATVETVDKYLSIAKDRFKDYKNIIPYLGDSSTLLSKMIYDNKFGSNTIFFLDAHWGDSCPLAQELSAIAACGLKPVIAIHDFKVPGEPNLGYDSWNNQEFTFEWLQPYFDKIYGPGKYGYHYNTNERSTQIKRGIIYIYPGHSVPAAHQVAIPSQTVRSAVKKSPQNGQVRVNLFLSFYNDPDAARQAELTYCTTQNILNPDIDVIFLVVDDENTNLYEFEKFSKIRVIKHFDKRPSYNELFGLMNNEVVNGNEISILSNTDIYFDPFAIKLIKEHLNDPSLCFALSAWDRDANGNLNILKQNTGESNWVSKNDSQDTWAFQGKIKPVPLSEFSMGRPGCDNAIAMSLQRAGYAVVNPSMHIKTIHWHLTGIRRYDTKDYSKTGGQNPDRVYQDYLTLEPCTIDDIPVLEPSGSASGQVATFDMYFNKNASQIVNWATKIDQVKAEAENQGGMQSQFAEEAIIAYIFENIGSGNKFFVDLGAGAYDGSGMSNTRKLRQLGWGGFGVDAVKTEDPWVIQEFIKPDNVLQILKSGNTPKNFAFLNLDIDSCDFWVLKQLLSEYRPRVICTEFNGTLRPEESVVLKYQEGYTWDKTAKYGYSFAAGKKLLEENGYVLVYNLHETNLFAVRADLMDGLTVEVTAKKVQYHPANPKAEWETY